MRILVLGAGGIGGYFGGRLAAGGADVTFLVRPGRAAQLAANGLILRSPLGDVQVPVRTVLRENAGPGWDAIILACKSYDLEDAIATIRPIAPGALIVPQLNGLRHLDVLDTAFGAEAVAGGVAQIGVTMEADGTMRHLNRMQGFVHRPAPSGPGRTGTAVAGRAGKGRLRACAVGQYPAGHVGEIRIPLHAGGDVLPAARRRRPDRPHAGRRGADDGNVRRLRRRRRGRRLPAAPPPARARRAPR